MNARDLASPSRRRFVTATAALGGGLLLGFGLPVRGEVRDTLTTNAPFAPNAFLRIDRAGKVTFVSPMIEMGQGTYTSLPMLVAEELEVDVDRVAIEHAPADDKVYVNPLIGIQMTGASTAIRGMYVPLRRAGATARVMLVAAAAQRWKVDPATCRAENGAVVHAATGRRLGYGALVDAAAKLPVPEKVALKEPAAFRLVGKAHRRLDTSGKVNGSARFGIDTRLPGMKFAVLAQSPVFGGKLASIDEAKAKAVPGVTQVVRLDDAVAVVANHTWAAKQGLAVAAPQWDAGPNAKVSMTDIVGQLARAAEKPGAVARNDGDAARAIAGAAKRIDAVYEQPFLAHATMEPMNCTVHLVSGRVRHLGRHAGPGPHAGRRDEAHRAEARAGAHPQSPARRRLRPPPGVRRYRARRSDRAARARAGAGDLAARGRHPARHVPAVLLRPPERGR